MNALRDFLIGCSVCGKPPLWRSLGHGRQRHLDMCPRREAMTDVKELLEQATPLPWQHMGPGPEPDGDQMWLVGDGHNYRFIAWTDASTQAAVDFKLATFAVSTACPTTRQRWMRWNGWCSSPLRDDFPDGGDIVLRWEGNRADWEAARAALRRLRLEVIDALLGLKREPERPRVYLMVPQR